MTEAIDAVLLILSTLFPIVDPLTGSPIFLAVTTHCTTQERRTLARHVARNSFFLMLGSYFIGSHVLSFFGVSLPVVQVAGGAVVVGIGWSLLMQKDSTGKTEPDHPGDVLRQAFYPLTMPLTVGPGSISVAVTLGANSTHHYGVHPAVILASVLGIALIAFSVYVCYGFADKLTRVLGETGMAVILRLASFLLLCVGVQIVWNGVTALLASAPIHLG